ncbi:type VII secretion target [Micromonospora sp. NPDC049366]|uniref:type VII secretion target n=1 Tax=Micromonospora sp. NPDC049366 TaxID=3364271 RepID=UPI0037B1F996
MAGEPGFNVDSQTLRTHAAVVDGVADVAEQCRRVAGSVQVGRDAYGRLCQLMPVLLEPVQETVIDTLGEAVGVLQGSADGLRAAADRYDGGDQEVAALFGQAAAW